jgi:lysophospholipase L1-like esterase
VAHWTRWFARDDTNTLNHRFAQERIMGSVNKFRYLAALGSSFAAGPTIEPIVDQAAMRSARNYPHLLAERLGAQLADLTVSGATTATILDEAQTMMDGTRLPPQILGVPPETDLVTITAGGNDFGFIGSVLYTALRRADPDNPWVAMMAAGFPDDIPEPSETEVARVADGLTRIVMEVRWLAPAARVVLVDYLTVLERGSVGLDRWFTSEEIDRLCVIQDKLIGAYARASAATEADWFQASALSLGHAVGSERPWVSGLEEDPRRLGGSFHPNEAGMRAIADALASRLLSATS